MAEEVKKIITVEVGKSITSVRDFKKHIEDLRGALLGLNEESDEYKTIAEQIATDQAKLNDVMKIGKGNTDAAAGSYVELNNQLKALRNQYKALSETERNSTTGQAILQNITKLDTQLKDIDESMGIYNRNVGNYKKAFVDAFSTISQQVGKVNPDLGTLFSSVQRLIPAFVSLGKTAKATGSIMKTAMSSTGIGLLVVALGEVITHWESIARVVSRVLGLQNQYTSAVRLTKEEMQGLALAAGNVDINLKNALDKARGLSDVEAAMNRLTEAKNEGDRLREEQERLQGQTSSFVRSLQQDFDSNNTGRIIDGAKNLADELIYIQKNYTDATDAEGKRRLNAITSIRRDLQNSNDYNIDITLAAFQDLKVFLDDEDKLYTKERKNQTERIKEREKGLSDAKDMEKANFEGRLKQTENYGKSQSQIFQEQYVIDREFINKNYKDNTELRDKLLKQLEKEYKHNMSSLSGGWTDDGLQGILDRLKNYGKSELEILDEQYQQERAILIKHHEDTTKLDQEYWEKKQAIINANVESIEADIEAAAKEIQDTWERAYQRDLQNQQDAENVALHGADMMWTINPKTHESDINLEREKEDKIYEIRKEGYQRRIALYEEHLLFLEAGSEEYLDLEREITQAKMDLDDLGYQHAVDLEERKRQDIQLTLNKWQEAVNFAQNTVSIFGSIAGSIADYTLEYAEEGTKAYKAAQITQAVISTLNGMVGVFSQALSAYGLPWGAVVGAAGATMMGTIGAMRINQIKNANANTNVSGGSSAGTSGVGVQPLLNPDYDLQRITNLSLQSDEFLPGKTQVYVLESDIQEVGNRVQVRENNATF